MGQFGIHSKNSVSKKKKPRKKIMKSENNKSNWRIIKGTREERERGIFPKGNAGMERWLSG